jgi:hypothetical protein
VGGRDFAREDAQLQKRLRETLALLEAGSAWADQMLALDNTFLKRLLKFGARAAGLPSRRA